LTRAGEHLRRRQVAQWLQNCLAELAPGPRTLDAVQKLQCAAPACRWLVLAFGKAARPMAEASLTALQGQPVRGLIVPPSSDDAPLAPLEVLAGDHPIPGAGSMAAGARALDLCRGVGSDERVLFLVSGGGSALLEQPLVAGVDLQQMQRLHRSLVGCGAGITEINAVRRLCSATKGGRLAAAAAAALSQDSLIVSDVPTGAGLSAVASGPTMPTPAAGLETDLMQLAEQLGVRDAIPIAISELHRTGALPPLPGAEHVAFRRARWQVLLDEEHAVQALVRTVEATGVVVEVDRSCDDQPYQRAAQHLLGRLTALQRRHPADDVAVISGGELSVPLPPVPGRGGRNQQFALECAHQIEGQPITVLSAGTDGVDGNSNAAGGVVDGTTMSRAAARGLDVFDHLRRRDAHPLLSALDDAVVTGRTATNLRDLRLLLSSGRRSTTD
jgi:glycerate 2-kinase